MDWTVRKRGGPTRRWLCAWVLGISALWIPWAGAGAGERARVVVVGAGESTVHRQFFETFGGQLQQRLPEARVSFYELAGGPPQAEVAQQWSVMVPIGTLAARQVLQWGLAAPTLRAVVPVQEQVQERTAAELPAPEFASALYVDQPVARLVALVRVALPAVRNLVIALGPVSAPLAPAVRAACAANDITCVLVQCDTPAQLDEVLDVAAHNERVLLVPPDGTLVNSATAKTLILGAYSRRVALIGYSQALVKAGALMAVHSSPHQLGREAAEMVAGALATDPPRLPPARFPGQYSVSVNYQVGRVLDISLPTEEMLTRQLQLREGAP